MPLQTTTVGNVMKNVFGSSSVSTRLRYLANRMIGLMIEAEVKFIVSSVKSRADIPPSSKRKKTPALSAVPEPDAVEGSGKKGKKPRRRRINLNDIQEVCGEWNRNVDVYALAIEATKGKGEVGGV
ncbi:hypothetical protein TrCOL_g821 [Triparma columacea]|uniref:Uncharacterized protein n=1 Tax=Triparma columacea TaxID=722753 RepID=A0A9W7GAV5_9STRA|nr:hypothetical protein TrCOL_g821 [Triparma columacea]